MTETITMAYQPKVLCSTAGMTENDWLAWRKTGIGGSEAGIILGSNPYRTKRELFYEKTGVEPVNEKETSTLALRWGHALEETVAQEFSYKTGLRVYQMPEMYQHPIYPFMQGNIDRFIDFPDGTRGILECKTGNPNTKSKWNDNSLPFHYEVQVRHYMAIMNINIAYVACLFENNSDTMEIRKIERDVDFEREMIAAEMDFWNNYVMTNTPPPFTENPELCFETINKYVQAQLNKKPVAIEGFDEQLPRIAELRAKKKELEDAVKAVQTEIDSLVLPLLDGMGNQTSATATVNGMKYDISYKPVPRTTINKDNLERLKNSYPDIYDQFVTTTTNRRLTFKSSAV